MTKTVEQQGCQGDVLFRRVREVPKGAREQARKPGEMVVVAHSETGHHHAIEAPDVRLLETESALVAYLRIEGAYADVVHQRPSDTHETLRLGQGIWEIRRQREHTPEGWRRVAD